MSGWSHTECWTGTGYVHTCEEPSGRHCVEPRCTAPAGTPWGPYWCPEHDVERLDSITTRLEQIAGDKPLPEPVMSELPEDAIEAAAKAIYLEHKLHPQLTFLWEDLVKSKDLANHNRVQRDRAYARAALSAAYPHLVAQAGADALEEAANALAPDTDGRRAQNWLKARAAAIRDGGL